MFGVSIPSISDVKNAVTGAASTALHTTEDLGASAVSHAASLGRSGLDLGRSAVDAVSHVDVQKLGSTAIGAIGKAEHAAEGGLQTGVLKAGQGVHSAADFARSHIPGDNPISNAARGAITAGEDYTRFDIGVVGGVGKAAVGLMGSAGQLGVMAAEYQASPSARAAINDKIVGGVQGAARSVGDYADSVAHDPTRVFGDAAHAAGAAGTWAKGEVKGAEQAIKDGHGPESFGLQVGNLASYLIPVGGEARLAVEGGELATRGLVTAVGEDVTRSAAEDGVRAAADMHGGLAAAAAPGAAAADVGAAGTIRNVNAVGGDMNCVNCAVATDAVLAGRPASALGGGPFRVSILEKMFGSKFGPAQTVDQIGRTMAAAGPGARGIVFGSRGQQVGHVFNVVNQDGVVRLLDGQTGKTAVTSGFDTLRLLRTN